MKKSKTFVVISGTEVIHQSGDFLQASLAAREADGVLICGEELVVVDSKPARHARTKPARKPS